MRSYEFVKTNIVLNCVDINANQPTKCAHKSQPVITKMSYLRIHTHTSSSNEVINCPLTTSARGGDVGVELLVSTGSNYSMFPSGKAAVHPMFYNKDIQPECVERENVQYKLRNDWPVRKFMVNWWVVLLCQRTPCFCPPPGPHPSILLKEQNLIINEGERKEGKTVSERKKEYI